MQKIKMKDYNIALLETNWTKDAIYKKSHKVKAEKIKKDKEDKDKKDKEDKKPKSKSKSIRKS